MMTETPGQTSFTWSQLPELSTRLVTHKDFLKRLVETNPSAGVKARPPVQYTVEQEERILFDLGWMKSEHNGKPYWYKKDTKESQWNRPKIPRPSPIQMDEEALSEAVPADLLLVSMALLSPNMSDAIILALVDGIQRNFTNNPISRMRLSVISLLLSVQDGAQEGRVRSMAEGLMDRINDLRDGIKEYVMALTNHAKALRMEALVKTTKYLQEHVSLFESMYPDEFDWLAGWMEKVRPKLHVTLEDLQGNWLNSQSQDVVVNGDLCTFSNGNPVHITQDETTGTFCIPGWCLSQERSSKSYMTWYNERSRGESTTWQRPLQTSTHDYDSYLDNNKTSTAPYKYP